MSKRTEFLPQKEVYLYHYDINIMSLEWWQKNVIYHIYLPSFKDSNKDGIGDFEGLLSKLDYFDELNIKTLMLSPFYPSPMKDNGYDVSSYIEIDPVYGTMDDFNKFMEEVKERVDMNVIVDLIANHTSDQHPWFQKSVMREEPYSDFYIWVDEKPGSSEKYKIPPNNWLSVFGGSAWTWNEHRKQFYFHQFLPEQPDLNFRNPLVKSEIKKVLSFWLEKGIDGFRIDAASHLFEDEQLRDEPQNKKSKAEKNEYGYLEHIYTKGQKENLDLLKEFRLVLDEYENQTMKSKIMITEVNEDIKDIMKYYGSVGDKIADFPMNFQLYKLNATSTGSYLFERINLWLKNLPKGKYPNWIVSSHDDPRLVSRAGHRLAASLQMVIMLLPGIPFCYYGDEIGMANTKLRDEDMKDTFALRTSTKNSRDPMRTPMQWNSTKNAGFTDCEKPWLPVNENYNAVNVEVENDDPKSFLSLFKHLIQLREEPSILTGLLEFPLISEDVFSFLRFLVDARCFLLVLNMSSRTICVDLSRTSQFLPNEGIFELSSGHFHQNENEMSSNILENTYMAEKLKSNASSESSKSSQLRISLNSINLQAKEAIIISYISDKE